jgi:hypothetical protein
MCTRYKADPSIGPILVHPAPKGFTLHFKKMFVCSNIRSQKEKEIATYSKHSAMIEFNDQSTWLVESLRFP